MPYARGMIHLLDLSDGQPLIPCRDPWQALALARLWLAINAPTGATCNAGKDVSQGVQEPIYDGPRGIDGSRLPHE